MATTTAPIISAQSRRARLGAKHLLMDLSALLEYSKRVVHATDPDLPAVHQALGQVFQLLQSLTPEVCLKGTRDHKGHPVWEAMHRLEMLVAHDETRMSTTQRTWINCFCISIQQVVCSVTVTGWLLSRAEGIVQYARFTRRANIAFHPTAAGVLNQIDRAGGRRPFVDALIAYLAQEGCGQWAIGEPWNKEWPSLSSVKTMSPKQFEKVGSAFARFIDTFSDTHPASVPEPAAATA